MKYTGELSNAKVVESTEQNKCEVMEAIDLIFGYGNRKPIIYVAINTISNRVFLCLYKEPLEKMGEEPLCLKRNLDYKWVPEKSIIELQLAKLNHDSPDSQ